MVTAFEDKIRAKFAKGDLKINLSIHWHLGARIDAPSHTQQSFLFHKFSEILPGEANSFSFI
jgi:hypothetical protein